MKVTNWFSVAAGLCFVLAFLYALYTGQPVRIAVMYFLLGIVNFILGTL